MMEIPKKRYQSPALTVVEFKTEKGYATSDPIKEWTGWSIDQEIYIMTEMGAQKATGELSASSFTDEGTVSGIGQGSWLAGENGWF